MLKSLDHFYLQKPEPEQGLLLALRHFILGYDKNITEAWKYGMPFFCYKGKMCCYLWVHKKYKQPYLGVVEGGKIHHPQLIIEKRARMKIILFDPEADIPEDVISDILEQMLVVYR